MHSGGGSTRHDGAAIHHHLSGLRSPADGDDADGRLPVLLRLPRLWGAPAAQARRLLRVLFLRLGAVPADPRGAQGGPASRLLRGIGEQWRRTRAGERMTGSVMSAATRSPGACRPSLWSVPRSPHPGSEPNLADRSCLDGHGLYRQRPALRPDALLPYRTLLPLMATAVLLHGYGLVALGPHGWIWLGAVTALGTALLWTASEGLLGRYLHRREVHWTSPRQAAAYTPRSCPPVSDLRASGHRLARASRVAPSGRSDMPGRRLAHCYVCTAGPDARRSMMSRSAALDAASRRSSSPIRLACQTRPWPRSRYQPAPEGAGCREVEVCASA